MSHRTTTRPNYTYRTRLPVPHHASSRLVAPYRALSHLILSHPLRCWRFPIGAVQDAYPLFGSRRRIHILGSWTAIVGLGVVLALFSDQMSMLAYGGACAIVGFLFVSADVAADAILLTFTGREAPEMRGGYVTTQSSSWSSLSEFSEAHTTVSG